MAAEAKRMAEIRAERRRSGLKPIELWLHRDEIAAIDELRDLAGAASRDTIIRGILVGDFGQLQK